MKLKSLSEKTGKSSEESTRGGWKLFSGFLETTGEEKLAA